MKEGYIYISDNVFHSLLAISEDEQSKGLMYVEPPAPVMSFLYSEPKISKFWMKNTKAPLDIVFCSDGKVKGIFYGEPYSTAMIGPNYACDMIIELPFGTVESLSIKIGQKAGLVKPTRNDLEDIFNKKSSQFVKL